jgi:hypothetical protein
MRRDSDGNLVAGQSIGSSYYGSKKCYGAVGMSY